MWHGVLNRAPDHHPVDFLAHLRAFQHRLEEGRHGILLRFVEPVANLLEEPFRMANAGKEQQQGEDVEVIGSGDLTGFGQIQLVVGEMLPEEADDAVLRKGHRLVNPGAELLIEFFDTALLDAVALARNEAGIFHLWDEIIEVIPTEHKILTAFYPL